MEKIDNINQSNIINFLIMKEGVEIEDFVKLDHTELTAFQSEAENLKINFDKSKKTKDLVLQYDIDFETLLTKYATICRDKNNIIKENADLNK